MEEKNLRAESDEEEDPPPGSVEPPPEISCPSNKHRFHQECQMRVFFNEPCVHVMDEMLYRMNRTDYWLDPHYAGEYTLTRLDNRISTDGGAQFEASHLTGDNTYTDYMMITLFKDKDDDQKCEMRACSTRRETSVDDSSTNFCNIYDLYCGNRDWPRCEYVKYDFSVSGYHEKFPNCHHRVKRKCYHPPEIAHNLSYYKSTVGGHGMERGKALPAASPANLLMAALLALVAAVPF